MIPRNMTAMEVGTASGFGTPLSGTSTPANGAPDGAHRPTKICVYCGSSTGHKPAYMEAARQLARVMAANNISLVYGGGTVGLMGELAKTLVSLSGPDAVHGIIPEALVRYERDPNYTSTTTGGHNGDVALAIPEEKRFGKTTVVKDMHTRKQMMTREVLAGGPGSGFIALPGGYGTMEELLETATWNQLGIHGKGICVLNVDGFYDGVLGWIRNCTEEGFIKGKDAGIIMSADTAEGAIRTLKEYQFSPSEAKMQWGNE